MADVKTHEYTLSVSEFAQLCNTTRDTLRHYYELGIILPYVNPNNGYHYYSLAQLSSFYYVTSLKDIGCSLKDIKNLMHSNDVQAYQSLLEQKRQELTIQLSQMQTNLCCIQAVSWLSKRISSIHTQAPSLSTIESIFLFQTPIAAQKTAKHIPDITEELTTHISRCAKHPHVSTYPVGASISYSNLLAQNYIYSDVFSIAFDAHGDDTLIALPSQTIVHCVHDIKYDMETTYKNLISFIRAHHFKPCSALYSLSLYNVYGIEEEHSYLKYVFLCVEEDSNLSIDPKEPY